MNNLELISIVTQVIGAIAVVISIVYLAKQIKWNTKALKAQASFDSTHSWATTNEMLTEALMGDGEFLDGKESRIAKMAVTFYDPKSKPDDLPLSEFMALTLCHRTLFQKLEGQYYMYKHGLLEPEIWKVRRDWAQSLVTLPVPAYWWDIEKTQSLYSEEFMTMISEGDKTEVFAPGKSE